MARPFAPFHLSGDAADPTSPERESPLDDRLVKPVRMSERLRLIERC